MSKSLQIGEDGKMSNGPDPLLEKIKKFILEHYLPAATVEEADTMMSTDEICSAIIRLHSSEEITKEMVSTWLGENGYQFFDAGKMRFEWLFKSAS